MIILPYALSSKSSKVLARALGIRRINCKRTTYHHRGQKVLNWGSQRNDWGIPEEDFINKPSSIRNASNKLTCLNKLRQEDINTLEFTTSKENSEEWLDEEFKVYCRTLLSSNSGKGIVVATNAEELVDAPLYTKGLVEWSEWRLHIGTRGRIAVQKKCRPNGNSDLPSAIRNHDAGYIFRRHGLDVPDGLDEFGQTVLQALALDFGAIDLFYSEGAWGVIEVNTACGLVGSTIEDYKRYFDE